MTGKVGLAVLAGAVLRLITDTGGLVAIGAFVAGTRVTMVPVLGPPV